MKKITYLAVSFILLIAILFAYLYYLLAFKPLMVAGSPSKIINITPGSVAITAFRQLPHNRFIRFGSMVNLANILTKYMGSIKPGRFKIKKNATILSVMKTIKSGKNIPYKFTIIPGWNKYKLMQSLIDERVLCNKNKKHPNFKIIEQEIKTKLNIRNSIEGMFLADTYLYNQKCNLAILKLAHSNLEKALDTIWSNGENELKKVYKNKYSSLIMASIVEKETGVAKERSVIASVFTNRLKKHMRLQTDPTVIYGIGLSYNGNITRKNLKTKTPYNTYRIKALPPTPICMVNTKTIASVFANKKTNYLYFVAKGNGEHKFSSTYREHTRAVRKYQLRRKKSYHSEPIKK